MADTKDQEYEDLMYKGDLIMNDPDRQSDAITYYEEAFKIKPDQIEPLKKRIMVLCDMDDTYESVFEDAKNILKLFPNHPEAHIIHGQILTMHNMYAKAIDTFATALKLDPDNAWAFDSMASSLSILGRHEDAADAYERATIINPHDNDNWFNLCLELERIGLYERSLETLEKYLSYNDAQDHSVYRHLGRVHGLLGNTTRSFSYYIKSVQLEKPNKNSSINEWRSYNEAVTMRRCIEDLDPSAAESFLTTGILLTIYDYTLEGLDMLETYCLLQPMSSIYCLMAEKYQEISLDLRALECFKRAAELADDSDGVNTAEIYLKLIRHLFLCQQFADVVHYRQEAISRGIDDPSLDKYHQHILNNHDDDDDDDGDDNDKKIINADMASLGFTGFAYPSRHYV